MKNSARRIHTSSRSQTNIISDLLVNPVVLVLMAAISGAMAAFGVTFIKAQSNTIYGCYKNENGNLRIVKEGQPCLNSESLITWNIVGPAGPPGQSGQSSSTGGNLYPFACPKCSFDERTGNRLSGKDLGNAILYETQFGSISLMDTNLKNAMLKNAKFTGTTLERTNFSFADLSGATFENVSLKGASFTEANISAVTWNNATCPDSSNSSRNGNTCEGHF